MTDNEIMKALVCCGKYGTYHCDNLCPMFYNGTTSMKECKVMLQKNVLDLINRQKAEINMLKNECFCLVNERDAYKDVLDTAVTEAIKEFAERLKDVFVTIDGTFECWEVEGHIDNLVNEMTGKRA